jgi:uncharacterized membrane protein YhaH (DUF805 family)
MPGPCPRGRCMYCSKCGNQVTEQVNFCGACGNPTRRAKTKELMDTQQLAQNSPQASENNNKAQGEPKVTQTNGLVNDYTEPTKPFSAYFRRWKDWKGTSSRSEFWAGFFWNTVLGGAAGLWLAADPYSIFSNLLVIIVLPVLLWLSVAIYVRRARDLGWEPTMLLILLIPLVSFVGLILLGTLPSKRGDVS